MKSFQSYVRDYYLESRPDLFMRELDRLLGPFSPIHLVEVEPINRRGANIVSSTSPLKASTFVSRLMGFVSFDYRVYPRIRLWKDLRIHSDRVNNEPKLQLKVSLAKPRDTEAEMQKLDANVPDLEERIRLKSDLVMESMVSTAARGDFHPRVSFGIKEKASSREECTRISKILYNRLKEAGLDLGRKTNGIQLKTPWYFKGTCLAHIADVGVDAWSTNTESYGGL